MARTLSQILADYGERVMAQADAVARAEAGELRDDIVKGSPVDKGTFRAAWQGPTKVGVAHYRVTNNTDYGPTIEYGGYPGVGPKTARVGATVLPGGVEVNSGIYPSQRPAAPVRQGISKRTLPLREALAKVLRQS